MSHDVRRVEVTMKSPKRAISIEVYATKDPVRAAKRIAAKLGFNASKVDWKSAAVREGRDSNPSRELEGFEEDAFLKMLTGEIATS